MKSVLGILLFFSSIVYAGPASKNPEFVDISINDLVNYHCNISGYFNVDVCLVHVTKCYRKYQWPKTVTVYQKINVMNECVASIYR